MSIIESLEWRAAIKKFDPVEKVGQEDLEQLLNAANLSATSGGLQPFKVVVVSEGELKSKLEPHGYGQEQFGTASHILVFAVETNISGETVDAYAARAAEVRGKGKEEMIGYADSMKMYINSMDEAAKINWGKNQAYISLGTVLAVAAEMRIDTCPMEGFDPSKFSEILDLEAKNLTPVLALPIGYRSAEDVHSKELKVRKEKENFIVRMS